LSEARFASAVHLARDAESAFHAAEYGLEELHAGLVLAQAIEQSGANPESELNRVRAAAISRGAELVVKEATARLGVTETSGRASSVNATVGERLVSVLFADVRDYAALTRGAAPASVAERIGALQRWATAEVNRHHGAVDKFAGDAVMATFNAGGDEVDHCRQALETALGIRDKAEAAGLPVGLAIATGPAIVGALAKGANLSVLGEATNVASRLQAQAQAGEILLSEPAFMRVRDWLRERQLDAQADQLQLKGFDAPVPAFRLRR
jgi:class 3 adenylate cyclase